MTGGGFDAVLLALPALVGVLYGAGAARRWATAAPCRDPSLSPTPAEARHARSPSDRKDHHHESRRSHRLHRAPGAAGPASARAWPGPGAGAHRVHRSVPHRHPRCARRLAGDADAAVRPRARGDRSGGDAGCRGGRPCGGGPGGDRVARLRLWRVPVLHRGLGDAVREPAELGLLINGTFAEFTVVDAAFATPVPDAVSSQDGSPPTCAGVTTYKGDQGGAGRSGRDGGGVRRRRARSSRAAVRPHRGWVRRRRRRRGRQTRDGDRSRCRPRGERPHDRSGRGDPGAGRCRRCGGARRVAAVVRPGIPVVAPRGPVGVRRDARGRRRGVRADLRHGGRPGSR